MIDRSRKEEIDAIRGCKSPQEVMEKALARGESLTPAKAQRYFDLVHQGGALSDTELDSVTGGACDEGYYEGYYVIENANQLGCSEDWMCNYCKLTMYSHLVTQSLSENPECSVTRYACNNCAHFFMMDGKYLCRQRKE